MPFCVEQIAGKLKPAEVTTASRRKSPCHELILRDVTVPSK
jgi:hypothetical protein